MKQYYKNFIFLSISSFLIISFYVGFYNYISQARHKELVPTFFQVITIGFATAYRIILYLSMAVIFSLIASRYLVQKSLDSSIFKKVSFLSIIMCFTFLSCRILSALVGRSFDLDTLKHLGKTTLILFPFFALLILPVVYVLSKTKFAQ